MREPQGVASLALGYVLHWAFSPPLLNPKFESEFLEHPFNVSNEFGTDILHSSYSKKAPFAKVKVFEGTTYTLEAKSLNIAHILNKCARKVVSLPRKTLKQWEIYMLHVYSHSHINIRYE